MLVNLLGCGDGRPARVPFAGQVLIDGKPLTAGFVRVVPDNARPATGEIDSTGHFRLTTFEGDDGCVVGRHPIEIIARKSLNPTSIQWLTPIKYQDATTSGLTIEVTKPVEDYKIELSWNGEQPTIEQTFTAGDTPSPE
ncbi:MAG TPA: hypothetical protein VL096_16210 [Pirellulaceae bacterium]|nr:hypothetical protein [Pirellulaceae bacterium]